MSHQACTINDPGDDGIWSVQYSFHGGELPDIGQYDCDLRLISGSGAEETYYGDITIMVKARNG